MKIKICDLQKITGHLCCQITSYYGFAWNLRQIYEGVGHYSADVHYDLNLRVYY